MMFAFQVVIASVLDVLKASEDLLHLLAVSSGDHFLAEVFSLFRLLPSSLLFCSCPSSEVGADSVLEAQTKGYFSFVSVQWQRAALQMVTSIAGGSAEVCIVVVQKHRLRWLEAHLCGQHSVKLCLCNFGRALTFARFLTQSGQQIARVCWFTLWRQTRVTSRSAQEWAAWWYRDLQQSFHQITSFAFTLHPSGFFFPDSCGLFLILSGVWGCQGWNVPVGQWLGTPVASSFLSVGWHWGSSPAFPCLSRCCCCSNQPSRATWPVWGRWRVSCCELGEWKPGSKASL